MDSFRVSSDDWIYIFSGRNRILFVKGLSKRVQEDHLKEIFNHFGDVQSVDVSLSRTGQKLAFIEFTNQEGADSALDSMNNVCFLWFYDIMCNFLLFF